MEEIEQKEARTWPEAKELLAEASWTELEDAEAK